MQTYIIVRHGSNAANQSLCNRSVLGAVAIAGHTTAQRKKNLSARIGASLPGTLDATTTFRQDSGENWHAYHNQHFSWIAWNKATAQDKADCEYWEGEEKP